MGSRYETAVDPHAANNAHAFLLGMVGSGKRVLELGAASGHVTRALLAQRCQVTAVEYDPHAAAGLEDHAAEVVVADLNSPTWTDLVGSDYEVITAGDVLEHLLDPVAVLQQMAGVLAPDGYVVVSLPHVAHADVRLSLLQGQFRYTDAGLLDATHIRFFTIDSLKQLVGDAGFVITEMKRVRVPAFESEQAVDRAGVSTAVLEEVLADPEAETYQFVFTLVREGADEKVRAMSRRVLELEERVAELGVQLARAAAAPTPSQRPRPVRVPAFESEQAVDRAGVSTAVLEEVLADPEAETYQFVFTLVREGADEKVRAMSRRVLELEERVAELGVQLARAAAAAKESELAAERAQATSVARRRRVRKLERELAQARSETSGLQPSRTRPNISAPGRAYGRVRGFIGRRGREAGGR